MGSGSNVSVCATHLSSLFLLFMRHDYGPIIGPPCFAISQVKGYVIKKATDEYGNTAEGTHTMKRIQSMPPVSPTSPGNR
jgi:hypothetical protein